MGPDLPESEDGLQIDPALRQLLLCRTGAINPPASTEEVAGELVPVLARLTSAGAVVPGLNVVARFGPVVTARVRLADLFEVRAHPAVISLKASSRMSPALAVSVPEIRARPGDLRVAGQQGLTGRGVRVAILDWGLDFAHPNFRTTAGATRVRALWDQRGGRNASSPVPFGYGRVHTRADLDRALGFPNPYAQGYDPISIDRRGVGTHATHVADIAVGNGRAPGASPGVAPEAELLFVHLSGDDTRPEDDLGDSVRLLEGVRWAVDFSSPPLILHMSLGRTGGAHDASPLVVQALDYLLDTTPGVAAVMSCGNYFDARLHASVRVAAGGSVTLDWNAPQPGRDASELEIWYDGGDRLRVILVDPDGRPVADLPPGGNAVVRDAAGTALVSGFHRIGDPGNGANHVDLFLSRGAAAGRWTVVLHGDQVVDGRADAYIERTEASHQSRFAAAAANGYGTTNSICNGRMALSVGAYDARFTARPSGRFSSAGPSRDNRPKPDLSAPGVAIQAARSAVRRPDGSWLRDGLTRKTGTSMAAPHVTGVIALLFEAAAPRLLPMALTRWILLESARHDPPRTPSDVLRYGAGRVDAHGAVTLVRAFTHELITSGPARGDSLLHTNPPPRDEAAAAETRLTEPVRLPPQAQVPVQMPVAGRLPLPGRLQLGETALPIDPRPPAVTVPDLDSAVRLALNGTAHSLVWAAEAPNHAVAAFGPANALPAPAVASVAAVPQVLALLINRGERVFLCADPTNPSPRWVDVPGLASFYALPAADQLRLRRIWAGAAARAAPGLTETSAALLGIPLLRLTLAHAGAQAFPVRTVRRGEPPHDVGGIVNGVTLPLLTLPLTEPACYLPVIGEAEGKLESINAWDLQAGVSLGPVQFNVERAALFRFLWRLWMDDRELFGSAFGRLLGWTMAWHDDHPDLLVPEGAATENLHGRPAAADCVRSGTYLQTGQIGGRGRDGAWRRSVAAAFRDVAVWPHVQQMVIDVSSWWLTPALRTTRAAGIGPLNPADPDRDVFVLTALLLSAAVRFPASLRPLLTGLRAWPCAAEKLAHWPEVLVGLDSRFGVLEPRLRRQQLRAAHVHDQARGMLAVQTSVSVPPG